MATATAAAASAAPATQRERKKFAVRIPIGFRPSNERHRMDARAAAATNQSTLCQGLGVQITSRISP